MPNCPPRFPWNTRKPPTLESPGKEGRTVPVHLHTRVTEVGTLELSCISRDGKQKWKLEFNVREGR